MKKVIRVSLLILLIAWMLLIFSLSAETATESSDKSGGFSYRLAAIFVPDFEDMSAEQQMEIIEKMSFPIRKSAHFCIFAVLGVLVFLNIYFFDNLRLGLRYILTFGFSSLYAASDELHQKFVDGRSGELRDWFIDSVGIIVGLLCCIIILRIVFRCRKTEGAKRAEKRTY